MVQGQQQQQQQQTNQNAMNYISNELLSTNDPNRIQSEKVCLDFIKRFILISNFIQETADALLAAAISKTNFGTNNPSKKISNAFSI